MKIGIVTVQDSNNFGSFLQAYALQHVLQEMGHEVVFIRSRSRDYIKRIFYRVRPSRRELLHFLAYVSENWRGRKKYRKFQKELKCFRVIDQYKDEPLDLVILGSDEIWNVNTAVFRLPIFYGEGMAPVMAYAVSIGDAEIEEMSCIPEKLFHRIQPILSRDKHTADFLRSIGIESPVVCYPTFLVNKSIFLRSYHHRLLKGQPFILIYSYGLEQNIVDSICAFARQHHLRILSACFSFEWCDGTFDCAALDFCTVLEQAAYVFTSTFHGTIFSILNHKQFVSLPVSRKTEDLLESLELDKQVVYSQQCTVSTLNEKLILQTIDYDVIDTNIQQKREYSLQLLREGIERNAIC